MNLRIALCVFVPALFIAACSSNTGEVATGPSDAVYEGSATDEALLALLDLPEKPTTAQLAFAEPAAQAKVSTAAAPTFKWTYVQKTAHMLVPPAAKSPSTRHELQRLFSLEQVAHAHGAPVYGVAYLLTFEGEGKTQLARVFTTRTLYTPTGAAWDKLKTVRGKVTVRLTAATFDNNAVIAGGGPFTGTPLELEFTP
jgi:hypothetical protein